MYTKNQGKYPVALRINNKLMAKVKQCILSLLQHFVTSDHVLFF